MDCFRPAPPEAGSFLSGQNGSPIPSVTPPCPATGGWSSRDGEVLPATGGTPEARGNLYFPRTRGVPLLLPGPVAVAPATGPPYVVVRLRRHRPRSERDRPAGPHPPSSVRVTARERSGRHSPRHRLDTPGLAVCGVRTAAPAGSVRSFVVPPVCGLRYVTHAPVGESTDSVDKWLTCAPSTRSARRARVLSSRAHSSFWG